MFGWAVMKNGPPIYFRPVQILWTGHSEIVGPPSTNTSKVAVKYSDPL